MGRWGKVGWGRCLIITDVNFLADREEGGNETACFALEAALFLPPYPCAFLANFEEGPGERFQEIKGE